MIILDSLLIGGLKFVFRRIAEAVDAQLDDGDALRETLLAAQMRLELGEIDDAEFARIEGEVLARLRDIRERAQAGEGELRVTGIEASVVGDGFDDDEGGGRRGAASR